MGAMAASAVGALASGKSKLVSEKDDEQGGDILANLPHYKRGGKVRRTGPAVVHKGERVLTAKQAKKRTGGKRGKR